MNFLILIGLSIPCLLLILFKIGKWILYTDRLNLNINKRIVILICINFLCVVIFSLIIIVQGDYDRPSTVDISPILQFEETEFNDFNSIMEKFLDAGDDFVEEFSIDNRLNAIQSFSYKYRNRNLHTSVYVYIAFYKDSNQTKKEFSSSRSISYIQAPYVQISDNIEIVLGNSKVNRSEYFEPIGRVVNTTVRVNNMIVKFVEDGNNDKTIGQTTNDAILNLCELLSRK